MSTKVVGKKVKGSRACTLQVDELHIDPSYQRGVVARHEKIVSKYNPAAIGRIIVGQRDDGTYWIVDGQQRTVAKRKLGHKTIDAEVFASDGPEHEAKIFRLVNKNRTALNSLEIYQAALTAGDEAAWDIKKVVEANGFKIPKYNGGNVEVSPEKISKTIQAIATLQSCYKVGGTEGIDFVLKTITGAWPNDPLRVREVVLKGIHGFWINRDKTVDLAKLIDRLGKVTPHDLIYSAGMGVGSRSAVMAALIEKQYRKYNPRKA